MTETSTPENPVSELVDEIIDVCGWLSGGESPADEFRRTVLAFEGRKLARSGYTLNSALTAENLVQFSLRLNSTGELCASLDVNPATGEVVLQQAWL